MEDKKMAKKTYKDRDFKFETLQLHVGQESPDPVTDASPSLHNCTSTDNQGHI